MLPTNLGLALILIVGVAFFPIMRLDGEDVPLEPGGRLRWRVPRRVTVG